MLKRRTRFRGFRASRRGGIYVVVVGAAILTSLIGVSGIIAARIQAKASVTNSDQDEARAYARAAIEMGRLTINTDPLWRTDHSSGAWFTGRAIGNGTCSLSVTNPNSSNLNNSATDPVILTGTGVKGRATQRMQVTLTASSTSLTCLSLPLVTAGAMSMTSTTLTSDTAISTNASITALLGAIHSDVQSVSLSVSGLVYLLQKVTTGITPLTLPDSTAVFSYYTTNGTNISFGSLPVTGGVAQISGQLLSSTNNTMSGGTNAQGIYVIDCANSPINITNCRIVGTLVLLHCPSTSTIQGSNLWQPGPAGNLPVLMVQGSIGLKQSNTALSEATANANFNPVGTAYLGATNTTKTDTYPSQIQGLVYVSGNLTTGTHPVINGCVVVGGTFTSTGSIDFTYDKTYATNPPPGFTGTTTMKLSDGTWAPVVN